MNWDITASSNLIESLGWTLVHSVWQIALISAILFTLGLIPRQLAAALYYMNERVHS